MTNHQDHALDRFLRTPFPFGLLMLLGLALLFLVPAIALLPRPGPAE